MLVNFYKDQDKIIVEKSSFLTYINSFKENTGDFEKKDLGFCLDCNKSFNFLYRTRHRCQKCFNILCRK